MYRRDFSVESEDDDNLVTESQFPLKIGSIITAPEKVEMLDSKYLYVHS